MSNLVEFNKIGNIGVIAINNPPVNALSAGIPEKIFEFIAAAEKDTEVAAIVLIGGGSTFVAGADIKEFVKMVAGKIPVGDGMDSFLYTVEDCSKPVVVALHGNVLGGGLELAMAAHYRICAPGTRIGQPEVNLGIIPGAGGTQRLPRLAGIAKAVEMCAKGAPIGAVDALNAGIVDQLSEGELLPSAIAFAHKIIGKPFRKTREYNEKLGNLSENQSIFASARQEVGKRQRGLQAPLAAIESIEAATKLPFKQGREVEREIFHKCLFSEQARALIHVFFSEREVSKIPDIPNETATIPVHKVAIVGAGTMGCGISIVFANAGIPVVLKEADQAALDRGMLNIKNIYANSVRRGRITQDYVNERMKLIHPTIRYEDFRDVDMVVEAVFESMALKKQVFTELDRVCKSGAILASNTSTLDIDVIAQSTSRPAFVIGTHFFSPANVMRLLELVRGKEASNEVIATCMQLARKLKKVAVLVGNCRGFVGNRMFLPYIREAQFLVEEGAAPECVDKALYDFGMAMGPLATGDMAGLDVAWRIRKEYRELEKPGVRQPFAEDILCELGRFGQKTGAGWYKYDENRRPIFDPAVTGWVNDAAAKAGFSQRRIQSAEIVERCVYMLINEGARILDEGYALRPADIDIVYLTGYGFPSYRGGPMWYADTVGLKKIYDRICEFHLQHGQLWEPAPLLKWLAKDGSTFADFNIHRKQAAPA